jgi:hypothetical protein
MNPSHQRRPRRFGITAILALVLAIGSGLVPGTFAVAAVPSNAVLDWNLHAIAALSNPATATPPGAGQTPPVAALHLAMVQIAVFDAVNAIGRRYEPYLHGLPRASRAASKAAAVATAAHHVLVGLTPALPQVVRTRLDDLYAASLAKIPANVRRTSGVQIGAATAAAMLAERAADGRYVPYSFTPGDGIGEWRPEVPAFASDPFAWVAKVRPFTLSSPSQFRTKGPLDITSAQYAAEFNEVKALGGASGSSRTDAQTELARFVSANPLPVLNAALRRIASDRDLSLTQAARLLATTSTSSADALIACWDDKDHWSFWRPITAIRNAADDGNPATTAQADWTPFLPTPPYPDHPSGFNCFTGAMMQAARGYFGTDRVTFELISPNSTVPRTYHRFTDVIADAIDGRIYTGFHFRTPDVQGAVLGKNVAAWVRSHNFQVRR